MINYSINGVPLDNPARGWAMQRGTLPIMSLEYAATASRAKGRDGDVEQLPTRGATSLRFHMATQDEAARRDLISLFTQQRLFVTSSEGGLSAEGRLSASSIEQHFGWLDRGEDLFIVRVPAGCWRGPEVTTPLAAAAEGAGVTASLFEGLSAPVQDALVRIKGPITRPQVTDPSGSFIVFDGELTSTQYLRFDSNTGRAWRTGNSWTGGTEMSGLIDWGGPRGVFEITPFFPSPADPGVREARLTLTQDLFASGAGFQVRGRPAVLL